LPIKTAFVVPGAGASCSSVSYWSTMDKNVHKEPHCKVDYEENIASKEVQNLDESSVVVSR